MASAQLDVGSTANSYSILARLASGGMAELFLARNASGAGVERYVVLKRVLRSHDSEEVQMLLDEAKLAAQLQHPNVAQVYDTGKLGDSFFFTMEYVHGETVREIIIKSVLQRRPIPIAVALTIIAGSAAGLHHAHERIGIDGQPLGIVHRDVSPSNLMVSYEGNVKVVDFGIAKARSSTTETRSGTVRGKIGYLSPEQCKARTLDRRSDLFSLGIVLWELLVGDRRYTHGSDFENMEAICNDDSPPPSTRRAEVPPELDAIVLKLLSRKPADRFQTGAELLEEIDRVAALAGWQLSTPALDRFMHELFGTRPQPWIELKGRLPASEPTVTAQPVDGLQPWSIYVDPQLSNVIDLAQLTGATDLAATPQRNRRSRFAMFAIPVLAVVVMAIAVAVVLRHSSTPTRRAFDAAPTASLPPPLDAAIAVVVAPIDAAVVTPALPPVAPPPVTPPPKPAVKATIVSHKPKPPPPPPPLHAKCDVETNPLGCRR